MSQVAFIGRLRARAGMRDELAAALTRVIEEASELHGRQAAVVHTSKEEPDAVVVYELFTDEPALADAGGSDLLRPVVELLAAPPDITRLTPVGGAGVPLGSVVTCRQCADEHLVIGEYSPAEFVCHLCKLRDTMPVPD